MTDISPTLKLLEEKVSGMSPFGKKVRFVLDGQAAMLDGSTTPPSLRADDGPADIVMTATTAYFEKLLRKEVNAVTAFMSGKIRVEGDLKAALPLMKVF